MLTISEIRNAPSNEWDEMWQSCDYSTYYHSREWAEIWQAYSNGRINPNPQKVAFSDGVTVLLPFSRQSYYGGAINRFSLAGPPAGSLPFYGNWLSSDTLTPDHVNLLSKHLINTYRNLVWRLNPFDNNSKIISIQSKYTSRKSFVSYMIDLSKGEERIYSDIKKNCRNKIQQGMKNKLVVREAENINEWKKYYGIYQDTVKRWGKKTLYLLGWNFFELLYNVDNKYSKLWLTWRNNKPIAGSICFYSHQKVLIWHSASLTEYRNLRPVNLSWFEIIKDGINKSYRWVDFETAGGNKGLIGFKKSFGPQEIMSDRIINWHPIIYYAKNIMQK